MSRWSRFDSIRQRADLLCAVANALERDTGAWGPLAVEYLASRIQVEQRNQRLWWAAVESGGILLQLARSGGLDHDRRLCNVVLTRWGELGRIRDSYEVPRHWFPGVRVPSLDIVLVEMFESACLLHERRGIPLRSWDKTDERAALFIRVLRALACKVVESVTPKPEVRK